MTAPAEGPATVTLTDAELRQSMKGFERGAIFDRRGVERIVAARVGALTADLADVVRARNYAMHQRDEERAAKEGNVAALNAALVRADAAEQALANARAYVDDPGNWSALDGRRRILLDLIDGPR